MKCQLLNFQEKTITIPAPKYHHNILVGRRFSSWPTASALTGYISGTSSSSSSRLPGRLLAHSAVQTAASSNAEQQLQRKSPAIQLTRRSRPISWFKWERQLYQQFTHLEQEQALLAAPDSDEYYYSYWDCPDSHLAVLQDSAYQAAWAAAFAAAGHLLKDKVVLDVGCGLGTLAMMAAKAGAKHVYAVDASPGAAEMARKVIAANGLANKVTVITGRAELVSLPVRTVDVIVSDWMGAMLLHEGLLAALLRVRDRWLAPGGIILPDTAQLHVMGVDDRQYLAEQSQLWSSKRLGPGPQAFDLKPVLNSVIKHARVDSISRKTQLVTDAQQLLSIDLYKVQLQDLTFQQPFTLTAQRAERVSGLITYFDVSFSCRGQLNPAEAPTFSTSPLAPSTSWLQTMFSFPRAIPLEPGQQLNGSFAVTPVGLPPGRMLEVDVDVDFKGLKARVAYQMKR